MDVVLANPRGFCAGVDRAIEIVDQALTLFGSPIYVRHEVVHNRVVVDQLKKKGAVFVENIEDIPENSIVIFSAHGVSQSVRKQAKSRCLTVFDATCPLVTKVHMEVKRFRQQGMEVILIGHSGHPEVEGTVGQVAYGVHLVESVSDIENVVVENVNKLAYVTQTTLSVDDTRAIISLIKQRFPSITAPSKDDICYATQNRQNAVRRLTEICDVIFVVGSVNSSNSTRLKELADHCGIEAYLIDGPEDICDTWIKGKRKAGVTAGASAPEEVVQSVVSKLRSNSGLIIEMSAPKEKVAFAMPRGLIKKKTI